MKVRYFLGIGILYIALISGYVFYITSGEYTLTNEHFVAFSVTLPIALWFCLPLLGLFIIATIYMGLMILSVAYKRLFFTRDIDKIASQIRESALGETPKDRTFSMQEIKQISTMLKRFYLLPNIESDKTMDVKLDTIFTDFKNILEGKESKNIKLNPKSPFYIQNIRNSMKNDVAKSLEILKTDIHLETQYLNLNSIQPQDIYDVAWANGLNVCTSPEFIC